MITSADCLKKYGAPSKQNNMILWDVPPELELGLLPNRIYCNKDLVEPLKRVFAALISTGLYKTELKTWDGCFCIRPNRNAPGSFSLHSWGVAVDVNAFENPNGGKPKLSSEFVKCWTDNGFDWGGYFVHTKDGMHFQLSQI